jgi:hypothetical protein
VAGALVDAHDRLLARPGRQAEHLAGLGVQPGALEVHALLALDGEVRLVCFLQLLGGDPDEAGVHVHECGHCLLPFVVMTR